MNPAILTANLGSFDTVQEPVKQSIEHLYHCFTDEDFPPIEGLSSRFQYRIPKIFGWQFYEGHEYYLWMDGSMTLTNPEALSFYVEQCKNHDLVVYKHPWRHSIKEEADHIEEYLKKGNKYITDRYANGLHKEQLADIQLDESYDDDHLYASTVFMYRDSEKVRDAFRLWWLHQSRYYTCDQLSFTYNVKDLSVVELDDDLFNSKYVTLVSKH